MIKVCECGPGHTVARRGMTYSKLAEVYKSQEWYFFFSANPSRDRLTVLVEFLENFQ
jgi:hypothetical protein